MDHVAHIYKESLEAYFRKKVGNSVNVISIIYRICRFFGFLGINLLSLSNFFVAVFLPLLQFLTDLFSISGYHLKDHLDCQSRLLHKFLT